MCDQRDKPSLSSRPLSIFCVEFSPLPQGGVSPDNLHVFSGRPDVCLQSQQPQDREDGRKTTVSAARQPGRLL